MKCFLINYVQWSEDRQEWECFTFIRNRLLREYNLGKIREKGLHFQGMHFIAWGASPGGVWERWPQQCWLHTLPLSKPCGPPRRECFPTAPEGEPGLGTWVGVGDDLLTSHRPPRGSPLPTGMFAKRQPPSKEYLRNQTLYSSPPQAWPWKLVICEKRHRENHDGTRFFSSKEKNSKWPNGTVLLANRVASCVLTVLKPRQTWENPKELVILAYSRSWMKWPRRD